MVTKSNLVRITRLTRTLLTSRFANPGFESGYSCLTASEREVMTRVVVGLPDKQVGSELGISEITVKAHRGSMMRKMKAESLAELVGIATRLRLMRPSGSALRLAK